MATDRKELFTIRDNELHLHFHPGQLQAWNSKSPFVFILAGRQSGKALSIHTPIPTPSGFVKLGDISIGDIVFDERGHECRVINKSIIMENRECYSITFDDGSRVIADADHQWLVQSRTQRMRIQKRLAYSPRAARTGARKKDKSIVTTREMLFSFRDENFSVDVSGAIEYPHRNLVLPPYFLGLWLGDGNKAQSRITTADLEAIEYCEADGVHFSSVRKHEDSEITFHYYASEFEGRCVRSTLIDINVLHNKHIPDAFMFSDCEQRLLLLQGLMDSDGSCRRNGEMRFIQKDWCLGTQVLQLIRSLGIKAKIRPTKRGSSVFCEVVFRTSVPVFRLARKRKRQLDEYSAKSNRRYVRDVERTDSVPVCCISVDSDSKLFVCGDNYLVTHNSSFAPWFLYREILRTAKSGEDNDYLAVSATNDLFDNAFLPAMLRVFCEVLEIGYYWVARRTIELKCLDPTDHRYGQFYQGPNGSSAGLKWGRIILRSAQSEHSLESMAAKACLLDECGQPAFTLQDWEAVQGRTAIARQYGGGRILGTTTPYELGWLYENIFIPWTNGNKDIDVIQFPSYWNPNFSKEEYDRQKATMPSWRAAMFLDGEFERPAGLIYHNFKESTMIVREPFEIPSSWERVVGVDFGGANVATLWLALNPNDGKWYAYHETLMGHMPTTEHAAMAIAEAQGLDRITAIGGTRSEGQHRDDWWNAGFYIEEPPVNDTEVGIARAISLIKQDKLRVFPHLERLRREFRNYRRKLGPDNEPTEQIMAKNKFHMLDALRYAASWIEDAPFGVDTMTFADFMKEQSYA